MAKCEACQAEVVWLQHERTGKWAPINAAPDPAGNVVRTVGSLEGYGQYRIAAEGEQYPPELRHTSHFMTCPRAKEFRRTTHPAPS